MSQQPFAHVMIRGEPQYRADAFKEGLRAAGFQVIGVPRMGNPNPADVLIIWNRYARFNYYAEVFERAGARVVVAENGALGRDARGGPWYSICRTNPIAAGIWNTPPGDEGDARWPSIASQLGVEICEWRKGGNEVIILAQRGIGPNGIRQPDGWHRRTAEELRRHGHKVRIREHPGEKKPAVELLDDLQNARAVVTWASGAAFKALLWGVPVFYGCHQWIGAAAAQPLDLVRNPKLEINWPVRLRTFQRLAWCQWRIPEIAAGLPFRALLSGSFGSATTTGRET